MGWLRSLTGSDVKLKDSQRQWYVDKESLRFWAESQGAPKGFNLAYLEQVLNDLKKHENSENKPKPNKIEAEEKQIKKK